MGYTIGYILIGICCFYIIRNLYVGSIMWMGGTQIVNSYNGAFAKRPYLKIYPKTRNYYLIVLNPFWWRFLDIYQNDDDGQKIKVLWKRFNDEQKNLRKLK